VDLLARSLGIQKINSAISILCRNTGSGCARDGTTMTHGGTEGGPMAYFLLSLDPDSAAITMQRYATKDALLKTMHWDGNISLEDYATDTDIGDGWESDDHTGPYRYIIMKGEVVAPLATKIIEIEEVDIP
jgi:hypothetical protein